MSPVIDDAAPRPGPGWEEFSRLTTAVQQVVTDQVEVRKLLEQVLAELTARRETMRPWDWATMTADDAEQRWPVLGEWVASFVHRHGLTGWVASCWAEHLYLIEELSVLRQVWVAAYTGRTASADAALGWLEAVERFRARIQDRDKGRCKGGHPMLTDTGGQATYPDWDQPDAWWEAFAATAGRDLTARRYAEAATAQP